jgi:hypothetical protein
MTLGTLAARTMVAFTDSFSKREDIVAVDPVSESESSPTPREFPREHSSDENGSHEADSQILVLCPARLVIDRRNRSLIIKGRGKFR